MKNIFENGLLKQNCPCDIRWVFLEDKAPDSRHYGFTLMILLNYLVTIPVIGSCYYLDRRKWIKHATIPFHSFFLSTANYWTVKIECHDISQIVSYYNDVIMSARASQITCVWIVYSTVCEGNSRWPMNSPHKGPVTRKFFHLMTSSCAMFHYGIHTIIGILKLIKRRQ